MKIIVISLSLIGAAAGAYAQGFIAIDNNQNTNPSPFATSGGLVIVGGAPINRDFNVTLLGGTDSTALSFIGSLVGQTGVTAFGAGTFTDWTGGTYPVPGTTTASTSAFFMVQTWIGSAGSYAAAIVAGARHAQSTIFINPVAAAPFPTPDLTGMPAIVYLPEPNAALLVLYGIAPLLIPGRKPKIRISNRMACCIGQPR